MNYKKTLNMPQSDFPMRANLPTKEKKIQVYWKNCSLYERVLMQNKNNLSFYFLQGPPYANHSIHIGHAFNATIKDAVIKLQWLNQKYAPFALGWDTHGLPIEKAVNKQNNKVHLLGQAEFYNTARDYALKQVKLQEEQFLRLGLVADFKNKYLTNSKSYIEKELAFFNLLRNKNLIYQARKPVYWSYTHQTALADAEIIYDDLQCHSCYFTFKINYIDWLPKNSFFCIWTTTPWTLLVNQAVAINQNFKYLLVENNNQFYVIGDVSFHRLKETFNWQNAKIIKQILPSCLAKLTYHNHLSGSDHSVILSKHVTDDAGTMLVHIAPAHGPDDYLLTFTYKLKILNALDKQGKIIVDGEYLNLFYEDASSKIIADLKVSNHLIYQEQLVHSTALDWRSKKPIFYLASKQWFIDLKPLVACAETEINQISFFPSWAKERLKKMLLIRKEWCISRQRRYGVPILVFFDQHKNPIFSPQVYGDLLENLKNKEISDWYSLPIKDLLSHKIQEEYDTSEWSKETDIMDVWFDSGVAFAAAFDDQIVQYDLVIEGTDQFRGWFNSSMLLGLASHNKTVYKQLLSHGFVLDKNHNKMSKSLGNAVDPIKIINQYGADILRLFFLSCDIYNDIAYHDSILQQTIEKYRKIRNTLRYLLMNLSKVKTYNFFHINEDNVLHVKNLPDIDCYVLDCLQKLALKIENHLAKYQFNLVISELNDFIINKLSSFYFEYVKDILYVKDPNSDRVYQVHYVLFTILLFLLKSFSPIIPHTCEEAYLTGADFIAHNKFSIFLHRFNFDSWMNTNFCVNQELWDDFFLLKNAINQSYDALQKEKIYNSIYAVQINLQLPTDLQKLFAKFPLKDYLSVGHLNLLNNVQKNMISKLNASFDIVPFAGTKCARCWRYFDEKNTANYEDDVLCITCCSLVKDFIKKNER